MNTDLIKRLRHWAAARDGTVGVDWANTELLREAASALEARDRDVESVLSDSVLSKIEDDSVEAANKMIGIFDMDDYYATMRAGIIAAIAQARK